MLKTNEIGLTENLKNDKRKFEIWSDVSSYIFEVSWILFNLLYFVLDFNIIFLIKASNEQEKNSWTNQIKNLLENQLNEIKCN